MNVGTEYKKLKAIDLFAGAGGFSLAAYKVGIDVQAAIELDKLASETYYMNLVDKRKAQTQVFSQDINSVDIDSLMKFQGINALSRILYTSDQQCW